MSQNGSSEEPGKLFVGGLSWETSQENLQRYFGRYGEVVDCVVMKNNETGRSRGFGFVTFKDPECVNIVLASGPHELDGRTIDPKSCNPRGTTTAKVSSNSSSSGGGKMRSGSNSSGLGAKKGSNFPKVFLGGLPATCTETDLRNFFSKYGKVMEVVIMYDQERKKSRGFGFLSFDNDDSVDRVCSEHYVTVNGKQVECKRAEPRDSSKRSSSGGGGGGGGHGGSMGGNWGGPNMMGGGGGGGGGWGGPMGGPQGPGGPSGGPGMGGPGGPMNPMANGMMPGYQGGWGGPQQQQTPYQGGYQGYQGWGTPAGFTPYGAPAAQYGQQGYGGAAGGFSGYSGYGNTMGAAAVGGGGATGDPYSQNAGGAGTTPTNAGNGPASSAGGGGGAAAKTDYSSFNTPYDLGGNYSQGDSGAGGPQTGRVGSSGGPAQGYHPYRRT